MDRKGLEGISDCQGIESEWIDWPKRVGALERLLTITSSPILMANLFQVHGIVIFVQFEFGDLIISYAAFD